MLIQAYLIMTEWLEENKFWFFSGAGVALVTVVVPWYLKSIQKAVHFATKARENPTSQLHRAINLAASGWFGGLFFGPIIATVGWISIGMLLYGIVVPAGYTRYEILIESLVAGIVYGVVAPSTSGLVLGAAVSKMGPNIYRSNKERWFGVTVGYLYFWSGLMNLLALVIPAFPTVVSFAWVMTKSSGYSVVYSAFPTGFWQPWMAFYIAMASSAGLVAGLTIYTSWLILAAKGYID